MKTALISIGLLMVLTSCSWYRDVKRSLVEDDEKQSKKSRTVPREQYDQLLVKYEELSKKYEQFKEEHPRSALVDELQSSSGENFNTTSPDTVDAFEVSSSSGVPLNVPADVESQLSLYRRGVSLKGNNPGEATKIFQQLEMKGVEPVKVRAKFQIGELLFNKGQYDLSLQVFEDIINKHASSGMVIDSLRFAVLCSEKLGIPNKKDQYSSMLTDVFEAR